MYPPQCDLGFTQMIRPNFRIGAYMAPSIAYFTPSDVVLGLSSTHGDIVTPTLHIWRHKATDPTIQVQMIIRDNTGTVVFEALDAANSN